MKQPKLSDLKMDREGTKTMHARLGKSRKIKITINVDEDSLDLLRKMAGKTGTPYQRILNQILKEGLRSQERADSRLEQIEKELASIKRKIAA